MDESAHPKAIDKGPRELDPEGILPCIWSVAMLYPVIFGIDWIKCDGLAWPELLLAPMAVGFAFGLFALGYSVVMSFQGRLDEVPTLWRDILKTAFRHYRLAPKTWTVTAIIFFAFLWTLNGRYHVHYYERGGTEFVRVEDRVTGDVKYRALPECPVEQSSD